jgi:hypothetical protein
MQDSKDIERVAQELAASPKTIATAAGQAKKLAVSEAQIDAINQVFMLFRVNYHNQYYSAYSDTNLLNQAKKLWSESLVRFSDEQILRGAKLCIEASDYLPTLNKMIGFCNEQLIALGLPPSRDAFIEACQAASPKSAQVWSHPAVYLAGKDSDWFFLANNPEKLTFPIYEKHYQDYCQRALQGEQFEIAAPEALAHSSGHAMTREQQKAALEKMRKELDI